MYHIFFILSSVEEYLGCFKFLVVMNKAAMNIVEHVSLWNGGRSFDYMPKSGMAESSDRTIPNFLRNCQVDFQSGCASLHSHQQ